MPKEGHTYLIHLRMIMSLAMHTCWRGCLWRRWCACKSTGQPEHHPTFFKQNYLQTQLGSHIFAGW